MGEGARTATQTTAPRCWAAGFFWGLGQISFRALSGTPDPDCLEVIARKWFQSPERAEARGAFLAWIRDVRFGRGGTVSFESLRSEFDQKSSKFCSHSVGIRQKPRNLTNHQYFLQNLAKFREIFIKIGAKFDKNCEKHQNFGRNFENCKNFPTKIC